MSISFVSWFGFFALCAYVLTLLPTWVRVFAPKLRKASPVVSLLRYRRQIGILVFILSLIHGVAWVVVNYQEIRKFHLIGQYWHGLSVLSIFCILAITSNNWCVKTMKKRWKQLHRLTYASIFLLTIHIWQKMAPSWTILTPISLGLAMISMGLIAVRFSRQWLPE